LAILFYAGPVSAIEQFTPDLDDLRIYDFTENKKPHGFRMDDKHFLFVDQKDNWAIIKIIKDQRAPGGPELHFDPETGEDESIIRFDDEQLLFQVRSEVILPAPPNYLRNPGRRYRITLKGLGIAPEYHRIIEVDAAYALDAVYSEMAKIYSRVDGIYREALFWGVLIAMREFNFKDHMRAEIPLTVLNSKGGQFRIHGPWMERMEQPRVERFAREGAPVKFERTARQFPDYRVPPSQWAETQYGLANPAGGARDRQTAGYLSKKSRYDRAELEPPDYRIQQVYGLGAVKEEQDKPGLPSKPLTVPEVELPAVSLSQRDTMDHLVGGGDAMGAMEARAAVRMQPALRPPQRMGAAPERERSSYQYYRQ